jgi:hypothetical protein
MGENHNTIRGVASALRFEGPAERTNGQKRKTGLPAAAGFAGPGRNLAAKSSIFSAGPILRWLSLLQRKQMYRHYGNNIYRPSSCAGCALTMRGFLRNETGSRDKGYA